MKIGNRVLVICTNLHGTTLFEGEGVVNEVRNHMSHQEYIIQCSDGKKRSVSVGDRSHAKDKICLV